MLSHSILESEVARVQLEDLEQLENSRNQTLLYDEWEDGLGKSIYGAVHASVGEYPIILGLDDMTGWWGTAEGYLESIKGAMWKGGIAEEKQVLACDHRQSLCDEVVLKAISGWVPLGSGARNFLWKLAQLYYWYDCIIFYRLLHAFFMVWIQLLGKSVLILQWNWSLPHQLILLLQWITLLGWIAWDSG